MVRVFVFLGLLGVPGILPGSRVFGEAVAALPEGVPAGGVFGGGEVGAVVVLPEEARSGEREAAEELARYWERLSGRAVEIRADGGVLPPPRLRGTRMGHPSPGLGDGRPVFLVGDTRMGVALTPELDRMKLDSVAIRSRGNTYVLRGATPQATRMAVYRFLHHAGVRWYMPEAIGEHVPENSLRRPPRVNRFERPSFASRAWSNLYREDGGLWERRALSSRNYRFHHNLHRVFTAEVYDEHPEFFILLGGQRIRPHPAQGGRNYQICFGSPEAAKFAARQAARFFDENPDEMSFSLGMNDTFPICQCDLCQEIVEGAGTFRDRPDYSDLVFTFMNRAAEELEKTHPDRYLGCLAYYWAENVPSFPVHRKVIPYLTADRFQWYDGDFRREDRVLMQRWMRAGPAIVGIYDYYYGTSFVIPRLATRVTEESLRHAAASGIEGFYAEIYSTWGFDAPKAWLASQLLWDVTQDRDELLGEFFGNFFGSAAAPMRRFFEAAEEIWMNQDGPTYWLKFFHDFTQLELFPPDICRRLRRYLDWAESLAGTELEKARVRLVSEAFRLTELYSELYRVTKLLDRAAGELTAGELAAALVFWAEDRQELEEFFREVIEMEPLHAPSRRIESRARFLPGMKAAPQVRWLLEAVRAGELQLSEARAVARDLDEAFPESRSRLALEMEEAIALDWGRQVLLNGSFRYDALFRADEAAGVARDYTPYFWERWKGEIGHVVMSLSDRIAVDGRFAVRAEGALKETLYQRFSATPGVAYAMKADAMGRVSPGSRVEIQLYWVDERGEGIDVDFLEIDPLLPGTYGDWHTLATFAVAPPNAREGYACLTVHHQSEGDYVFFDRVRVYEWDGGRE